MDNENEMMFTLTKNEYQLKCWLEYCLVIDSVAHKVSPEIMVANLF